MFQVNKFFKYCLDLKAIVPVWEAVRHFDTILLAYVIYHFADRRINASALHFTAPS